MLLSIGGGVDSAHAQTVAGKITALNGNATITRAARTFAADYLAPVDIADELATTWNGLLTVTLIDNSQFELTESSTLLISENLLNPNGTRARTALTLLGGLVRSVVKVASGVPPNYEVHTPNAVAAARGTIYDTYYTNNETRPGFQTCKEFTDVFDYEGVVAVRSLSNPSSPVVLLHSGQKTTIPCGLPVLPAATTPTVEKGGSGIVVGVLGILGAVIGGTVEAVASLDPSGAGGGGIPILGTSSPRASPELDPGSANSALTVLAMLLLLISERFRRR